MAVEQQQWWQRMPRWAWIVGVVVALGAIGSQMGDDEGAPATAAAPVVSASPSTAPTAAAPSVEPSATKSSAPAIDAVKIEADALASVGLDSWQQACADMPDGWMCYVAGIEAISDTTAVLTLQITEKDEELAERAGVAILNFVGNGHPGLAWVQVNNATGDVLANASRDDAPLVKD